MSVKMKFGSKDIPFVYKGDKLIYPNPIKDGLLLWYDFKGMRNTDTNKEIAKDLSGNGNDGTLTNFNFTEESGYNDNTLVFDEADDSLTIPELELDKTAMSVMHDGKIYSYEDDKVLTVGIDGEIFGENENLIATPKDAYSEITSRTYRVKNGVVYWTQNTTSSGGALSMETYASDLESDMTFSFKTNNDKNIRYYANSPGSGTKFVSGTVVKENDYFVVSMVLPNFIASQRINFYGTNPLDPVSEVKFWDFSLVRGNTLPREYSPAPSDYKTTTLAPTSLADLQLYNKTLSKDELLHNAESKGLKKLKPGVVVQDGLVLHYDFSHESNTSEYKDKAFDYSGNGNHGELQNFNFTEESGYEESGLKFDGVDDEIFIASSELISQMTYLMTIDISNAEIQFLNGFSVQAYYLRKERTNLHFSIQSVVDGQTAIRQSGVFSDSTRNKMSIGFILDRLNNQVELIANGVPLGRVSVGELYPTRITHLGRWRASSDSLDGSILSTHIYNRKLTPEEIAHNYQIEKEKFNIVEGEM